MGRISWNLKPFYGDGVEKDLYSDPVITEEDLGIRLAL
jgi:hypothetical protein